MRMYKGIIAVIVCLGIYGSPVCSIAQQKNFSPYIDSMLLAGSQNINCGIDNLLKELRKNPAYVAKEKKMNDAIYNRLTSRVKVNGINPNAPVITLPVVVHIINPNPAAITDAQVLNGINDLNDAFSKNGAYAASKGVDTRIRFVLAQKDESGGITNGITRTTSFYSVNMNEYTEDLRLKNIIDWDPTKYINVWLVTNIVGEISAGFSCGVWTRSNVGGYATMPLGFSSFTEGIVVPGFGIVLAHEMGHYLGLYHTFEGGCTNNNCLLDGDRVCDTPPDGYDTPVADCSKPSNSCTTDTLSNYSNGFFPRDTTDQVSNFMDYNNPVCTNQFSDGQAERMQAAIATQRPGLLSYNAATKPCNENILAGFTRDISDPKIGEVVTFTNASSGAVSYQWLVDGGLVSTQTNMSRSFVISAFPVNNKHTVVLKAIGNTCFSTYTDYILVNCGLTARFSNNKRFIASQTNILNDTILFTNNSIVTLGGTTTYQWVLTNTNTNLRQIVSTNAAGAGGPNDLNYLFPTPANYNIRLRATNGACVDSSELLFFSVADPRPDVYMSIISANCYQDTKVRVSFYVCNFGYDTIMPNIPISFYDADPRKPGAHQIDNTFLVTDQLKGYCCGQVYTQILNVGYAKLNTLFAVANNITTSVPIVLPDPGATFLEKVDSNNIASYSNFRFTASVTPAAATLEPGDTLLLKAQGSPDGGISYAWSPPNNLSCTTCNSPFFYADTNALTTKQVIVKSFYQCTDTALINITVPAYNDFTVTVNSIACAGTDSLAVNFTVKNLFKRGIIPKNLLVSFYKDDPSIAGAVLLAPVFKVPDSVAAKQQTYTTRVRKINKGNVTIFASVNDNGTQVPTQSSSYPFAEKLYTNNTASLSYQPVTRTIDTSICNGDALFGYAVAGTYTDILTTANGCDSIRILILKIKLAAVQRTDITAAVCQGQTYAGYSTSGTYVDVYKGVNSCDSIRTLHLTVNSVVTTTNTIQICSGNSYTAGGKAQTQTGRYVDSFKTSKGCDSIVVTLLTVNALPANFLPKDTTLCLDKTLTITLGAFATVNWSTGSNSNTITISLAGAYSAQVVDRNGCAGTSVINVAFEKCIPIQIPNAFTPNGDYRNDIFRPLIGARITNYKMQIWSRWGQLLFETHNYAEGWNGKYNGQIQPNGAYVYFISFTDPDGVDVMKKGTLLLIR